MGILYAVSIKRHDDGHGRFLFDEFCEGIFLSPEGASVTAAYDKLLASGYLKGSDRVVLFNTGAGLKYTDVTAEAMKLQRPTK